MLARGKAIMSGSCMTRTSCIRDPALSVMATSMGPRRIIVRRPARGTVGIRRSLCVRRRRSGGVVRNEPGRFQCDAVIGWVAAIFDAAVFCGIVGDCGDDCQGDFARGWL